MLDTKMNKPGAMRFIDQISHEGLKTLVIDCLNSRDMYGIMFDVGNKVAEILIGILTKKKLINCFLNPLKK